MALRIQRLPTEWTGRAAGPYKRLGTTHERAGLRRINPNSKQIWPLFSIVGQLHVLAVLRWRLRLDHHRIGGRIPGQCHRPHAEELDDGFLERELVHGVGVRRRLDRVEQVIEPMSESRDLDLFESDADQCAAFSGLEEESSIAGLTERSGKETIRAIKDEESTCHQTHRSAYGPGTVLLPMSTRAAPRVN